MRRADNLCFTSQFQKLTQGWILWSLAPPTSAIAVADEVKRAFPFILCSLLRPHVRKHDHIPNRLLIREQHHQAIDAQADSAAGGMP